jgi:putative DNA methylase
VRRLIEEAFPLKKVSEDSKHEKSAGRKGHISTLHIWPARRPLAASRAAVIATLLPDPADAPPEVRHAYQDLAGSPDPIVQRADLCQRIERVTRWNGVDEAEMDRLRGLIRLAHGGRAPTVLDIFAGGGAIPLEAMRLGCNAVAIEYNPVAWFILKCTLEYPSKLAGKKWPLPTDAAGGSLPGTNAHEGDLAAQVRYWGEWVRARVEQDLAPYFPIVDGKPAVAYFWARTIPCQDRRCGATVPLLKTLWLCTKKGKERALRLRPNPETKRVEFDVFSPASEDDLERGTVVGTKAFCPFHPEPLPLPIDYMKECGRGNQLGVQLTAVAVAGPDGKEYRAATDDEVVAAHRAVADLPSVAESIPFGVLRERICDKAPSGGPGVSRLPKFGLVHWGQVFAPRQQLALAVIARWTRQAHDAVLRATGDRDPAEAVLAYLYCVLARAADRNSSLCTWQTEPEKVHNAFADTDHLSMTWDFCEVPPSSQASGGFSPAIEWVAKVLDHLAAVANGSAGHASLQSATSPIGLTGVDAIITDPPYYGAIPYADLSDFFHVWLRRVVGDRFTAVFGERDTAPRDEELVEHAAYGNGTRESAKRHYLDGMARAFGNAVQALAPDGAMVIVFANKQPEAWDALVTSLIAAGCTVTGSWPIDTERTAKMGAKKAVHLATSVWLVCRKRAADARAGRYAEVRREMQERIAERLGYFWAQEVHGPDFVWAAVGPALESYSKHREVRRLDGTPFTVTEFLREVRRLVTDFALKQVLHGASTEGLDEWTRYYLMHRDSFKLDPAPPGECILLAQGYNLDLDDLRGPRGILSKGKRRATGAMATAADGEAEEDAKGSGSDLRLLAWHERRRDDLGEPQPSGGLPLIDALHRMMQLWDANETGRLRDYVAQQGLGQNELFWTVAQAVLEISDAKSRERAILEALVAWGRGAQPGVVAKSAQQDLFGGGIR